MVQMWSMWKRQTSKNSVCMQLAGLLAHSLTKLVERLKMSWHSPVYGFFSKSIVIGYENGRKFHYFKCTAKKCKSNGGVRRYQDSKDRAATGNLKSHAVKCFGQDVVDAAFGSAAKSGARDGSIFASFARQGQQPLSVTHRAHTNYEVRAHVARWCAESNRVLAIVKDRMFNILMKAGRPGTSLPSPMTVSRDIQLSFDKSRKRINTLLNEHKGLLHLATDAWTSPNHRAFVGWTVHLHHEGHILTFVLDILEVPEVCCHFITHSYDYLHLGV
jgi:hypothetical protein